MKGLVGTRLPSVGLEVVTTVVVESFVCATRAARLQAPQVSAPGDVAVVRCTIMSH